MYVVGSYLILVALVLLFAAVLFTGALVVMTVREVARLLREMVGVALAAGARLAAQWVPKPVAALSPHHRTQHSSLKLLD